MSNLTMGLSEKNLPKALVGVHLLGWIDLSHSAAMLRLRKIKSFVFARLASH